MNINPFDILKNAQKIQEQMGSIQEKLGNIVVTGTAGGGMVEIDMNGRMELTDIRITKEVVDPADIPMLQDLIKAAFANASEKAKEAVTAEMGALAGGMGMPPGFTG
ncbi:YbaB/EbfC family nucleoid-associated protein [Breznakiella homolactica]|uniref:Nucleoid-associated protein JFL75_02220 n=1 Tax=Breznakiella homolactica TaxID=2798577 RepID=A0A7T7XNS8_9SPIR|nr:YbaB/EbfC family nucleoid-associated protein [Breznakiella homolactica]QQO09749.1 YbaB/EbfC family nucleoid-associated protein [Breznakiella homolactica]